MQGERFTAQIPPIVSAPSFTIRKKSEVIFKLEDYVATNRLTENQAKKLKDLIRNRKNILVSGGPGSGKTTVTNALVIEAVEYDKNQRFLILEDLPELQCEAQNKVAMLTSDDVNMTGLLRAAMRMRPDRILIGEVRGREALDMLKAWNTGCPGGICTVHANGASEAIQRILDLAMEAGLIVPPIQLVSQTIDAIVSVTRKGNQKGFIHEILALGEYKNEKFIFEKLA
jgi:type IV secretion system protein VirB11